MYDLYDEGQNSYSENVMMNLDEYCAIVESGLDANIINNLIEC